MVDISLISDDSVHFIETLGFPIFVAVIILSIVIWMMKKDEKRQQKSDERYTELVNEFISSIKTITKEQSSAMQNMTLQLEITTETINRNIESNKNNWELVSSHIKEILEKTRRHTEEI